MFVHEWSQKVSFEADYNVRYLRPKVISGSPRILLASRATAVPISQSIGWASLLPCLISPTTANHENPAVPARAYQPVGLRLDHTAANWTHPHYADILHYDLILLFNIEILHTVWHVAWKRYDCSFKCRDVGQSSGEKYSCGLVCVCVKIAWRSACRDGSLFWFSSTNPQFSWGKVNGTCFAELRGVIWNGCLFPTCFISLASCRPLMEGSCYTLIRSKCYTLQTAFVPFHLGFFSSELFCALILVHRIWSN